MLAHDQFIRCKKLLQFGLVGYKFNYKNQMFKKALIQLSSDMKKINYNDMNSRGSMQMFKKSSSVNLDKFSGVIYGGQTENFKKHKRALRRNLEITMKENLR